MTRLHHSHHAHRLEDRAANPISPPKPMSISHLFDELQIPDIVKRMPASSTSQSSASSSTCGPNDNSPACQKPVSSEDTTLPIVLGVVIPLAFALILFVYLHRRHVRKLRSEDAEDKHKSLDFGMGPSSTAAAGRKKKGKGGPEMIVTDYSTDREIRRERGLSMDMGSPYILPPGLQNSRDSLHSLSRLHNGDDRYRPATTFFGADTPPIPSYASSRKEDDDSSSHTSSSGHGYRQEGMKQDLLRNAQRMSRSLPPAQRRTLLSDRNIPQLQVPEKAMEIPRKGVPPQLQNGGLAVTTQHDSRESYMSDGAGMRKSNNYLGPFIHSRDHSVALLTKAQSPPPQAPESLPSSPPPVYSPGPSRGPTPPVPQMSAEVPRPPRLQSVQAAVQPVQQQNFFDDESDYGDDFKVTPPSPTLAPECQHPEPLRRSLDAPMQAADEQTPGGLAANDLGYNVRRLSTGVRPLPPDDPSDNPEQRANRIRSFYKEYFDESRPGPSLAIENYYQDYSDEYLGDATVYDPVTGQFVVGRAPSYAQPFTRRAMTPPPRAPPRFQGGQRHHATMSTMSSGRFMPREPRAFSSASARFGPPGRGPPRKAMPPPAPLRILPTPHMLREDSFAMPLDFAPPTSYKDRQAGRPASPRGGMLPYSPTLPARTPLVSSFQDLAVMPSPHAFRKSGTFTALDFAPPPRFRGGDSASDSGSVRSNRSAMSAAQLNNIRAGAYRVSRIPKEVVFSKSESAESLKPTWGLRT